MCAPMLVTGNPMSCLLVKVMCEWDVFHYIEVIDVSQQDNNYAVQILNIRIEKIDAEMSRSNLELPKELVAVLSYINCV